LQDAFASLAALLTVPATGPTYYFFYFDRIDSKGHFAGPDSPAFDEAVEGFFTALHDALYQPAHGKAGKTLLLLSADHGHTNVDPQTTFYLNVQMPDLIRLFKTNGRGAAIAPAGSPRDMFLYLREEHLAEALGMLQQRLAGRAEIYSTQDLLGQGFFGPHAPSPDLLGRLGNVVILPYAQETVWWLEAGSYDMTFLGHHGGLTPHEMEIPLLALTL
jgi:predicted AlkP superfamily pyrophosphatase or phosphodiesterase